MDLLTNLLACVGKPIYLLSVVVQTNVVPDHWGWKGVPLPGGNGQIGSDQWTGGSTNYAAELVFGQATVEPIYREQKFTYSPGVKEVGNDSNIGTFRTLAGYKTNLFPMFTNFIALPEPERTLVGTSHIGSGSIVVGKGVTNDILNMGIASSISVVDTNSAYARGIENAIFHMEMYITERSAIFGEPELNRMSNIVKQRLLGPNPLK